MKTLTTGILIITYFLTFAQTETKATHYTELKKHLPAIIQGYKAEKEAQGATMDMSGMSYSTASQEYINGNKKITINIVDYSATAMLYTQATAIWNSNMAFEDDKQKAGTIEVDGFKGWEVIHKDNGSVELMLGVFDRYFIAIKVNEGSSDLAKAVVKELALSKLPK